MNERRRSKNDSTYQMNNMYCENGLRPVVSTGAGVYLFTTSTTVYSALTHSHSADICFWVQSNYIDEHLLTGIMQRQTYAMPYT